MSDRPERIVLLPGMDGSGALFARFVATAPPGLRTQVVSYPPDRPAGYAPLAEWVRRRLPQGERFVLLGESFSGPIALRVAADAPEGLTAVVLCATFVRAPVAARRLGWLAGMAGRPRLPAWVVARVLAGNDVELAEDVLRALEPMTRAVLAARVRAIAQVDAREDLRRCPVPLLVLRATEDRLLGAEPTGEIAAERPDALLRELQTPHLLLQTAPEQAWELLRETLL